MKEKGITLYLGDKKGTTMQTIPVRVMDDLSGLADMDIIVLGVKNYSLETVSRLIREKAGDRAVIVSMANGVENQRILPKYFTRVVYCVVSYNAWMDTPVVVGYQKRGPLILGTPDNSLRAEMEEVAGIFNKGVETVITDHFQDAAHSKIVVNLTNSLTTLVGHGFQEISDFDCFQRLLTSTIYEGVRIVRAAGYKECKLGGMPSWTLITLAAKLPRPLVRGLFKKNVAKMVMSSMSQDIIKRGGTQSELDSLTGYIVSLADRNGVKAPFNRTIYELSSERFSKSGFKPMDVQEVWAEVQKRMK
jgi:2-dehydropantoate 2-reductase